MRAILASVALATCVVAVPVVTIPLWVIPAEAAPPTTKKAAQPAPATPAAPAPAPVATGAAPDEAHQEAAALTEMLGTQNSLNGFVAAVRDNLVRQISAASGKPLETVAQTVDQVLMPDLVTHTPELRNAVTEIWVNHFTVQELKDLHAFYLTPLGAKLVRSQPEIAQQTQAYGRTWAEKYAKETGERHLDELRRRGLIN